MCTALVAHVTVITHIVRQVKLSSMMEEELDDVEVSKETGFMKRMVAFLQNIVAKKNHNKT